MRRKNDFYETDRRLTEALLRKVYISGEVIELCAGDDAITDVLVAHDHYGIHTVWTNDIDPTKECDFTCDATDPLAAVYNVANTQPDWIVTNPPFSQAHLIIPLAYQHAQEGIAMLLRLSYLEPTPKRNARGPWLIKHASNLSNLIIFNPRPSYTGNGSTDSVTSAWMVWQKARLGVGTKVDFVMNWRD